MFENSLTDNQDTNVGLFWSALGGVVLTFFFYLIFAHLLFPKTYFYTLFVERGDIPYWETFFCFAALTNLALKRWKMTAQRRAFDLNLLMTGETRLLRFAEAERILDRVRNLPPEQKELVLVKRVKRALTRFLSAGSSAEVDAVIQEQSGIDFNRMDATFSTAKFLIWVIPVVGFIGTVYGISMAIGNFSTIIANAANFESVKGNLGGVTNNLAIAFETTYIALLQSIVIMFSMSSLQKTEENFLTDVEEYCLENLVNKIDWLNTDGSRDQGSETVNLLRQIASKLDGAGTRAGGAAATAPGTEGAADGVDAEKLLQALSALPQGQDVKRLQMDLVTTLQGVRNALTDLKARLDAGAGGAQRS